MEIVEPGSSSALGWYFDPPRETLKSQADQPLSSWSIALALCGSLLSITVAELLIVPSQPLGFGFIYFSYFTVFVLTVFLFYQLTRLAVSPPPSFGQWVNAGALALLPFNLLLPAALACHSLGNSGFLLYEVFKLFIVLAAARRWVWAIESLTRWPLWACTLLLMTPFCLALAAFAVLILGFASILIVALLAGLS